MIEIAHEYSVIRYFVEVQNVERQNVEIQIVYMKNILSMYPNLTKPKLTWPDQPNLPGYHLTSAVGT
jgi:hypothetical protein